MKKAKLSKKFLSLALTLCMVFQLVPVFAPQAQAGDVDPIVLNFQVGNSGAAITHFTQYNQEKDTSKVWYYDSSSTATITAAYGDQLRANVSATSTFIVKFYAESAGVYKLTGLAAAPNSANVTVEGSTMNANIASGDFEVGNFAVYEGWNTFAMTGFTRPDLFLKTFTLTYVSKLQPSKVTVNFASDIAGTSDCDTVFKAYNQDKVLRTWRLAQDSASGTTYYSSGVARVRIGIGQTAKFEFYVPAAGKYSIAMNRDPGAIVRILANNKIVGISDAAVSSGTIGVADLTVGWNTLTIYGSILNGNVDLKGFTATPVGNEQLPFTMDFLAPVESGWGADAFNEFASYNQDYAEKTWRFLANEGKYMANNAQINNVVRIAIEKNTGSAIFEFYAPSDGYYQMNMYYQATAITAAFAIDGKKVAELDASGSGNLSKEIGGVYLEKGTHKMVIYNKGSDEKNISLRTLTFTPATAEDVEDPTVDKVFGDKCAYVYQTETGYQIHFVGGITGTDYSKVGFEISVNGAQAYDKDTNNVYKKVMFNDTPMSPADFGAADGYIFYVTDTISLDAVNVTITPYAVGENGRVYRDDNKSYTINLASLK